MDYNIDEIKKRIQENYPQEIINSSIRISSSEVFAWESIYQINFSSKLKEYLNEIGIFQFSYSFYECLDSEEYYLAFLEKNFIEILKNENIKKEDIDHAPFNYNIKENSFGIESINTIYKKLDKDESCIEIAVCLINDTYNCYHYLMLTGKNRDYIVDSWGQDTYENVDYFWNFLLNKNK